MKKSIQRKRHIILNKLRNNGSRWSENMISGEMAAMHIYMDSRQSKKRKS